MNAQAKLESRLLQWVTGWVIALTLLRLGMAPLTELLPEEAYYWTYSQHPALSYFDHPPMVAWLVGLGTALLGNTELGVRLPAIVLWPGSASLLYLTARLWFDARVAGLATLLFSLCPVFVGIGFIITPDFPLLFFWLLTMYASSKAMLTSQHGYWLLAGLGLGLAMLSKYTAVMLGASLLLFLLFSNRHRHWLAHWAPWAAVLLAFAVFSPVIIWNAQHEWASFLFQSTRTEVGNNDPMRVEAGTFWLYQLSALTPLLFLLYAYALIQGIRRGWLMREDPWNFALSFALPLFALFTLASFKTKGHINWTAPAYLSWSIAAAAVFLDNKDRWLAARPMLWRGLVTLTIAICVVSNLFVCTGLAWGFPPWLAFRSAGGWRGLAHEVNQARASLSQQTGQAAFILGADKYNLAAELGFYTTQPAEIVNDYALGTSGLGYRFWIDRTKFKGRPAVAVFGQDKMGPYSLLWLTAHFEHVSEGQPLEIQGQGLLTRKVVLVNCLNYHE